jgi:hypothetical protein
MVECSCAWCCGNAPSLEVNRLMSPSMPSFVQVVRRGLPPVAPFQLRPVYRQFLCALLPPRSDKAPPAMRKPARLTKYLTSEYSCAIPQKGYFPRRMAPTRPRPPPRSARARRLGVFAGRNATDAYGVQEPRRSRIASVAADRFAGEREATRPFTRIVAGPIVRCGAQRSGATRVG